jgi:hypothetical protein
MYRGLRRRLIPLHTNRINVAMLFITISWDGARPSPLGTSVTVWPIAPAPGDRWWWVWSSRWNENWKGKPKYSEKTYANVNLSTTNATRRDLVLTRAATAGSRRATNRLSTAISDNVNLLTNMKIGDKSGRSTGRAPTLGWSVRIPFRALV